MYRESELRTRRAKYRATIANERGQAVEALAKNLQRRTSIVADYGYEIEEYGLLIQYHAQRSLMYVSLLKQGLYSTDLLIEASRARLQSVKARVQAVKLYCQANKAYIRFHKYGEC
ncbi:hypothetical protein [Aliterella atlantica]|uniref:Uncharacterized protein n=1 Tax=Aliterella atlantica CENA595 TaxID=1618023 RepID=A0A0D8ZN57_9CYAN|nr:hypothetical protein [Aliterella atlantica]KJH69909.1 hypothetical protein UH38_20935 [Aliterella atlantica CENA595]